MESDYIKIVNGDLLLADEKYIVHQCNCVSTNAKTLALQIFKKYPFSNSYQQRNGDKTKFSKPGTIEIFCSDNNDKSIVNFYSQFYPSTPKYSNDSYIKRLNWFKECLNKLLEIKDIFKQKSIALPYNIGCGAAGGDWKDYFKILKDFAEQYKIKLKLYKL